MIEYSGRRGLGTVCSLGTYNVFTGHDYNEGDDDMALIRCCAVSNPKALILNSIDLLCSGILLLVLGFLVYHRAYFSFVANMQSFH